ncbi:MAG: hypothetical protein U0Q15_09645 [Kineosporiaceae bacterium]
MDDLDAVTRDLLAAPFAIDLSDPQSSPPRPDSSDGSPWWTPVLAGAALVALLGVARCSCTSAAAIPPRPWPAAPPCPAPCG